MFTKIKYLTSKLIKRLCNPSSIKACNIDHQARISKGCNLIEVNLGKYSYLGSSCTVLNAHIGKFCSIADDCKIGIAAHPKDWVSTSPIFHEGRNIFNKNFSNHQFNVSKRVIIGNDVWIGYNCLIMPGIKIGNGAIIGAGSIVTKDVEPYSIVAGVPAKKVNDRFEKHIALALEKSNWWDLDDNDLSDKARYFNNVELFLNHIKD